MCDMTDVQCCKHIKYHMFLLNILLNISFKQCNVCHFECNHFVCYIKHALQTSTNQHASCINYHYFIALCNTLFRLTLNNSLLQNKDFRIPLKCFKQSFDRTYRLIQATPGKILFSGQFWLLKIQISNGISHCELFNFPFKTHSLSVSLENCIQILQTWLLYLLISYIFSFLPYLGSLIIKIRQNPSYGPVRDYVRDGTISYGPLNMKPIIGYLILSLKSNSQFRTCS